MRIVSAFEDNETDEIIAVVEFDKTSSQTVRLPSWATKQNILDEAVRLRARTERRASERQQRPDLEG